ncbi:hypothetical protein UlMin_012625 [Ulmus minor]
MNLNKESDALLCRLFSMNLGGHARVWFHNLPAGSISSFQDFFDKFIAQFAGAEPVRKPMNSLKSIKQQKTESLRGYIKRFNGAALQVVNYNDQVAISHFISNVHKEKPYYYLVKLEKGDTLAEMIETMQKFALTKDGDNKEDQVRE